MKESIIRDQAVLDALDNCIRQAPEFGICADIFAVLKDEFQRIMEERDAAPVVHTRWAHLGGDEWCCPVCGFVITTEGSWDKPTKKYCEDCGAKMDGGDSDACVGSNDFCSYGERREDA
nr:MAG TPA: DNA-directed RNA polymerase [Caudoviricetes sp.]